VPVCSPVALVHRSLGEGGPRLRQRDARTITQIAVDMPTTVRLQRGSRARGPAFATASAGKLRAGYRMGTGFVCEGNAGGAWVQPEWREHPAPDSPLCDYALIILGDMRLPGIKYGLTQMLL